jgi:hypothetical protein
MYAWRAGQEKEKKKRAAPVVVLGDDVVLAREARGGDKIDRLEIPHLLLRGFEHTSELPRAGRRTPRL